MCKAQNSSFETVRQSAQAAGLSIARSLPGLPGVYEIPSATETNSAYTVTLAGAHAVCSCPAGERGAACWHAARARELHRAAILARGQQAIDDLFGKVA